jgi:hypothetical protein
VVVAHELSRLDGLFFRGCAGCCSGLKRGIFTPQISGADDGLKAWHGEQKLLNIPGDSVRFP